MNGINIISDYLFVVKDLKSFISNLEKKGFILNKGLQSKRGQVNSFNSFLSCLGIDFRTSFYNVQHVYNSTIDPEYRLHRSKFSFENIHNKLVNIR